MGEDMEKLNYTQLYSMLILIRLFEHISSFDVYCRNQILGVLVSGVFQVLTIVLIYIATEHITLMDTVKNSTILRVAYTVYLVLYGGISFNRLVTINDSISQSINGWICILLLGITCIYCSKLGFKAIFRSSLPVVFFSVVGVIVLVLGILPKMSIDNLYYYNDNYSILYYALSDYAKSSDLILLVLLIQSTYSKRQAIEYVLLKSATVLLLSIIGLSVIGGVNVVSKYSFISLCGYSQPLGIERLDGMYILLITMVCVVNVSLCTTIASSLLGQYCKYKEYLLVLAMIVVSYLTRYLDLNMILPILILLLSGKVPSITGLAKEPHTNNSR